MPDLDDGTQRKFGDFPEAGAIHAHFKEPYPVEPTTEGRDVRENIERLGLVLSLVMILF